MELVAILGSATPPGRLHRAVTDALGRAADRCRSVLIDLAEHPVGVPTGTRPQDDGGATAAVVAQIDAAPALLLATPTYRGSMTGVLKNLLDQVPLAALRGKPVGCVVMGASQHHFLGADRHLRDVLAYFGALVAPVTAYLTSADFTDGVPSDAAARDVDGVLAAIDALRPAASALSPLPAPLEARGRER